MRRNKHYILTSIAWLVAFTAFGQDFASDMKSCAEAYRNLTEYHVKAKIAVYTQKGDKEPVFTQETKFHKYGDRLRYEMESMLMIQNAQVAIWIDHQGKEIFCQEQPRQKGKRSKAEEVLNLNIDSLLQSQQGISYEGMYQGLKHYRVSGQQGEIQQSELYLNPKTFLLDRMEYQYAENPLGQSYYAIVQFIRIPAIAEGLYSEAEYVKYQKKTGFELMPKYRTYELTLRQSPFEEAGK